MFPETDPMYRLLAPLALVTALSACGAIPQGREPARPVAGQTRVPMEQDRSAAVSGSARICLAELGTTGAQFAALPDRYLAPGCNQLGSVQIDRLSGDRGQIELANIGPVACPVAQSFAAWARFSVDRAARIYLGSPVRRIETMGSYSCRNVAGTTRLSAHSRAEAIDIAAFVLSDGRRVSVKDGWHGGSREEREFLRSVRDSACKRFGTVLGPEYNAAHGDHFHLEGQDPAFCR